MNQINSQQHTYQYNPSIDVIRFFSFLLVLFQHWGLPRPKNIKLISICWSLISDGNLGVNIFFVISGFLITYGLLTQKEAAPFSLKKELGNFYIKRFFRIFPIYYLLLFLLFAIDFSGLREHFLYYLFYISNILVYHNAAWNNFSHTWSLAIEEQFYLLWPLVIFCLPQQYFRRVVVVLVLAVIIFLLPYSSDNFISVLLPANLITLCAGSLLAYYVKYHFDLLKKYKNYIYILGILSCFLYAINRNHTIFSLAPERICHTLIALMLIVFAIAKPDALNIKPLVFLGKISYGLYLYHYVIGYIPDTVFSSLTGNPAGLYIIKLVLLFSLAIASYLLIEKQLIRYSKTRLLIK